MRDGLENALLNRYFVLGRMSFWNTTLKSCRMSTKADTVGRCFARNDSRRTSTSATVVVVHLQIWLVRSKLLMLNADGTSETCSVGEPGCSPSLWMSFSSHSELPGELTEKLERLSTLHRDSASSNILSVCRISPESNTGDISAKGISLCREVGPLQSASLSWPVVKQASIPCPEHGGPYERVFTATNKKKATYCLTSDSIGRIINTNASSIRHYILQKTFRAQQMCLCTKLPFGSHCGTIVADRLKAQSKLPPTSTSFLALIAQACMRNRSTLVLWLRR